MEGSISFHSVLIQLMHILAKHRYPYIISTKGTLLANQEYLDILRDSNVYVRFSVTVVAPELRKGIDRGCPNLCDLFAAAKTICQVGVPVSFRLQPIFPGHEDVAYALLEEAGKMGVKHISMEYLKVPIDANIKFSETVRAALGSEPIRRYIEMGSKRNGREYILPFSYRAPYLLRFREYVKKLGMTFGFADNDLLIFSDGDSCCSASDLYLTNMNTFKANIVGMAKGKRVGDKLSLSDFHDKWYPKHRISPYLNSRSRISSGQIKGRPDWPEYVKEMWNSSHGIYNPAYFVGIRAVEQEDESGNIQYERVGSEFDLFSVGAGNVAP